MATAQLRPMSVGEILDASFALLRRHAGVLLGTAVACLGVPQALDVYVTLTGGAGQHLGIYFVALLFRFIGYLVATGATIRVVSQAYLGHEPELGEALTYAVSMMGRTLIAGFGAGILIGLATLLLIIPGIIVACGLSVTVQAAVLEPVRASDAVGRSWQLTKGFKGKAFSLYFIVGVLFTVLALGIGVSATIAAALWRPLLGPALVLFAVLYLFYYPFSSCVFTLFYYDLRVRKEAFDLEMLSQHIGIQPALT